MRSHYTQRPCPCSRRKGPNLRFDVAYAGTYTVEDDRVIHHIGRSWNATWEGTQQVRYIDMHGRMLTYTSEPANNPLGDCDCISHRQVREDGFDSTVKAQRGSGSLAGDNTSLPVTSHRRLERIRHVNRKKSLLFSQGVSGYEPLKGDRRKCLDHCQRIAVPCSACG
jgi:hypothetical protein